MQVRPTIQDIAKRANVSKSTVSLVFLNRPGVGEETRERVLAVAAELGYKRRDKISDRARAAEVTGVAFLVADRHFFGGEIFYSKIFAGAKPILEQRDFHPSIYSVSNEQFRGLEPPQILRQGATSGLMVAGDMPEDYLNLLAQTGLPLVMVDYETLQFPWVAVVNDNLQGAEKMVEHLIGLGHRRIACLAANCKHPSIRQRIDGYILALARHQIAIHPKLRLETEENCCVEVGGSLCASLLKSGAKPTAIFCATDAEAIGAMKTLHEAGLSVPGQVSVAGFDNLEWGELCNPSLTTVNVHRRTLGAAAAQMLLNEMLHRPPQASAFQRLMIPVDLIIRQSTAPCARD